jgi:hypothetical protein
MADENNTKQIWKSISSAIGVEVREATTIRGGSGQDHPVQAIAVDDKTRRVVIFSAEPSPRIAALMQSDVQVTLPAAHVLVARPVIFNLSEILRRIAQNVGGFDVKAIALGLARVGQEKPEEVGENVVKTTVAPVIDPLMATASKIPLPVSVQIMDIAEQLINLDWKSAFVDGTLNSEALLGTFFSAISIDSAAIDRQLGICPIPLYDFSETDFELLLSGQNIEEIQSRLKALGIYQYFFPAPDQLILGLAENKVTKEGSFVAAAEEAPAHGHPLGNPELFPDRATLLETLAGC